jgi:hypothetical protein
MTLVELLAASALTLGIMSGVLGALLSAQTLVTRQADRVDATQRVRVAVDLLSREIRDATLVAPAGSDSAIEVRNGGDVRVYYLGDAGQVRRDAAGTDLPVLDGVERLRFEYGARTVRVSLVVRDARGGRMPAAWDVEVRNLPWR